MMPGYDDKYNDFPKDCYNRKNVIYSVMYNKIVHECRFNRAAINKLIRDEHPLHAIVRAPDHLSKISFSPSKSINDADDEVSIIDLNDDNQRKPPLIELNEVTAMINTKGFVKEDSQADSSLLLSPIDYNSFDRVVAEARECYGLKKRAEKQLMKEQINFLNKMRELKGFAKYENNEEIKRTLAKYDN